MLPVRLRTARRHQVQIQHPQPLHVCRVEGQQAPTGAESLVGAEPARGGTSESKVCVHGGRIEVPVACGCLENF